MPDDAPKQPGPPEPVVVGGYRIERLIGVGGAAAVYEARRLGRSGPGERVACKVLHRQGDPLHRALVWREAVLGLRFTPGHANLLQYLDFLDDAEEQLCVVMELVEGASVHELREPGQRLPFPVARRIAVDVLEALAYLHGRGVLHRDLSLNNIMVTAGGVVKVADFGLARVMDEGKVHTGTVRGTAMYMSPETVQMLPLDGRSDLFSLAAILFDLVAGMPPCGNQEFIGAMIARNGKCIFEPLPPDTPPDLAELITGLLREDRSQRRPQTVAEALALLRGHDQVIASPDGLAALAEEVAQSRREAVLAAALAAARHPRVLAPGHVLAQRMTRPERADGASPERKPEADALSERVAYHAADAPLDRGAERVADAVPEHIDDVLPDGLASRVPALVPEPAAEALPDRASDGTSRGALHRRSRRGVRVAARRVLAVAVVACVLVLGLVLGGRGRVEHDVPERPQPPDLPAPMAGPAPRAPSAADPVTVKPGPRERAGETAAGRPDGPRGKRFEARRRARLFGPAPVPWQPVPVGGEPPPW